VSVRIRLTRAGRKKVPHYRIVVMDSRNRRDGAYLDQIGVYHPNNQPAQFDIQEEKALQWLSKGAVPSDTVRSLLSKHGILLRFDLTRRETAPEKITEAVMQFKAAAAERDARREAAKKQRRKAKLAAGDVSTPSA
jgi:small subunit ribosomal protein S16